MELLQAGVDRAVIALWLGHESVETTQIYLDANLALKEDALKKTSTVRSCGLIPDDRSRLLFPSLPIDTRNQQPEGQYGFCQDARDHVVGG